MLKRTRAIAIVFCLLACVAGLTACGGADKAAEPNAENQVASIEYYTSPAEVGDYRSYALGRIDDGCVLILEVYEGGQKNNPISFDVAAETMDPIEEIYAKYHMEQWAEEAAKSDVEVADAAEQQVKIIRADGTMISFGSLDKLTADEKAALSEIGTYMESLVDVN